MEIHANKLPGYLMIEEHGGKARAEAFLQSYPDRGVVWMTRFVQNMAEYYGTTQTLAKTRLLDMGYSEVRGAVGERRADSGIPFGSGRGAEI